MPALSPVVAPRAHPASSLSHPGLPSCRLTKTTAQRKDPCRARVQYSLPRTIPGRPCQVDGTVTQRNVDGTVIVVHADRKIKTDKGRVVTEWGDGATLNPLDPPLPLLCSPPTPSLVPPPPALLPVPSCLPPPHLWGARACAQDGSARCSSVGGCSRLSTPARGATRALSTAQTGSRGCVAPLPSPRLHSSPPPLF